MKLEQEVVMQLASLPHCGTGPEPIKEASLAEGNVILISKE